MEYMVRHMPFVLSIQQLNDLCAHFSSSCFIDDTAVFFGTFLGPIFAILIVNVVMFVLVIGVIIRHTRSKLVRTKEQMKKKEQVLETSKSSEKHASSNSEVGKEDLQTTC